MTPTQFWRFFREDEFEDNAVIVASGNFSQVRKARFKDAAYLQKKNKPTTYANQYVALKVCFVLIKGTSILKYDLGPKGNFT